MPIRGVLSQQHCRPSQSECFKPWPWVQQWSGSRGQRFTLLPTHVHHELTGRWRCRLLVNCFLTLRPKGHEVWKYTLCSLSSRSYFERLSCTANYRNSRVYAFLHRQHTPSPSWLLPLFATPRSCLFTLSSASETPICDLQYLITCQYRMWHSHNFQLSDFSPTKKKMQKVSNISILVMYCMYFLAALFGYLTFYGESRPDTSLEFVFTLSVDES